MENRGGKKSSHRATIIRIGRYAAVKVLRTITIIVARGGEGGGDGGQGGGGGDGGGGRYHTCTIWLDVAA